MKRRDFVKKAGIGSAALVSLPDLADALTIAERALQPGGQPADTFLLLLDGPYIPVPHAPNLGLLQVDLSDSSYNTTKIYRVSELPGDPNRGNRPDLDAEKENARIGNFYLSPGSGLPVAYDLPGGAMTMVFTANNLMRFPNGQGGTLIVGTFDLDITEGTGVYQSFVGGHNRMVDLLHRLADGTLVEHCFCIITAPNSLP
jgi:hypothetical protein